MLWRLVLALALSLLGAMAADQVIGEQEARVSQHEPFLYGQRELVTADEILAVVRTKAASLDQLDAISRCAQSSTRSASARCSNMEATTVVIRCCLSKWCTRCRRSPSGHFVRDGKQGTSHGSNNSQGSNDGGSVNSNDHDEDDDEFDDHDEDFDDYGDHDDRDAASDQRS